MADIAGLSRPSAKDGADQRARAVSVSTQNLQRAGFMALTAIPIEEWRALAERAIEPNGYYLPAWELAVNASARGRTGVLALGAWREASLVPDEAAAPDRPVAGRLRCGAPAKSPARFGKRQPLRHAVHTVAGPWSGRGSREGFAERSPQHRRACADPARRLANGAAMKAFTQALRQDGLQPIILHSHLRACLDARRDADEVLRDALSAKKLKELRRQRNRLAEHGAVRFEVARSPTDVSRAVEVFLALEASGWKGERGTALRQHEGDASFIRRATRGLAETGQCEIVTMHAGDTPVAAAVVLRHQDRAFYFKLGIDERFAKFSPGVQLTLDLTRHLCADAVLVTADPPPARIIP